MEGESGMAGNGVKLTDIARGVFMLATAARLMTRREVEAGLNQVLPGAAVLKVKTGTRSKGYKFKNYTVSYRDIVFTFKNYQEGNFFFAGKSAGYSHNYCEKLFQRFSREIGEIAERYQVTVEGKYSIGVTNRVAAMEEIGAGARALEELYQLMKGYIPRTELRWFPFELKLYTLYGKLECICVKKQGDWNYSHTRQLLYLNFKAAVDMGLVKDVALSQELLDAIPQKYIQALYINGEPYVSNDYDIRFIYSLENRRYYAPVGFGIKISCNGGVEDYLQREIIKAFYPNAQYTISMKDQTTSYQIGADRFQVRRGRNSLTVWKNGRKLPVKYFHKISDTHTGAEYYYWVSLEDFAMLMGMSVDKVERDGVYLRLP